MPAELMVLTILKALVELAGLFLLGQGMLYLLAGEKRVLRHRIVRRLRGRADEYRLDIVVPEQRAIIAAGRLRAGLRLDLQALPQCRDRAEGRDGL